MIILSLGAGVQSTTLALMAAAGEVEPMPDAAIFADTMDEPAAVYTHLAWLRSGVLPYPVHVVSNGSLSERLLSGDKEARPPFFFEKIGMMNRQCTRNYKVRPIRRRIREMLGATVRGFVAAGSVELWIGISLDEAFRVKPANVAFITHRWPLIEHGMNRGDCLAWLAARGHPRPPRSACVYCPFKTNQEWRDLRAGPAADWQQAVALDARLREPEQVERFGGRMFAHKSRLPLDEADFGADEETNPMLDECEGMCGV